MRGPIEARPERTAAEIENDAKEAGTFFEQWNWTYPKHLRIARRDVERRVEAESYSGRLTACVAEAVGYSYKIAPDNTYEAKKLRAAALSAREEEEQVIVAENRRPYVSGKFRRQMPKPRLNRLPYPKRAANRALASRFWGHIESPTLGPALREKIVAEATVSFQLWLLTNPHYGPIRYAPEGYAGTSKVPTTAEAEKARQRLGRYKAGRISPVGMTLERAIQIAIAAAEKEERN